MNNGSLNQPAAVLIRPMLAADLTSILRLALLVREAPSWTYDDFQKLISPQPIAATGDSPRVTVPDAVLMRRAWVAELVAEPVGQPSGKPALPDAPGILGLAVAQCLQVGRTGKLGSERGVEVEAELESILVHPEVRRQAIGSRLLNEAAEWCRLRSASVLRLEVRSSNQPALALYQRHGFQTIGHRPGYYRSPDEDAVLMELVLGL